VSLLDLIGLAILAFSIGAGFMAGFARAGIGFLAGILGVVCGFWFYGGPAAWVHQYVNSVWASNLLGFLLVYWAFLLAGALIGRLLSKLFKWTGLSWIDRLMGAVFGLVRGSLITVAFIAVLMAFAPKPLPNWMVDSKLLPYAMEASSVMAAIAPNPIKDAFRTSMRDLREIWEQQLQRSREKRELLKSRSQKKQK
jgi:membrane protein required for colicin V production